MTAPIQEPTTQRAIGGLAWGESQLARRPASAPSAFLESGVAFDDTVDGTATVSTATATFISFDQIFVSAGATSLAIDTPPAPASTLPFVILEAGWFIVQFDFKWAATGDTDVRMYEMLPDTPADNMAGDSVVIEVSSAFRNTITHSFGPLHWSQGLGTNTLRFRVEQASGVSKTITSVMFTVLSLGPDIDEADFPLFP